MNAWLARRREGLKTIEEETEQEDVGEAEEEEEEEEEEEGVIWS